MHSIAKLMFSRTLEPMRVALGMYNAKWTTIDNEVINCGIQCTEDTITVNFVTKNPFHGRLFVKGMSDKVECMQSFDNEASSTTQPTMSFGFGACNMHRSRMIDPQPGMMQSIVVVISFHSMLTTGQLLDTARMPTCLYEVRRGGADGPIIRFAQVGEPVHHIWSCDSDSHKILVKNCYVDDGQGNQVKIINEHGCAIETVIIGDLTYEPIGNAKAWVDAYVFKFADKPHVFFHCTIQLCNRGDQFCENLTPPRCGGSSTSLTGSFAGANSMETNPYGFIFRQQKQKYKQRRNIHSENNINNDNDNILNGEKIKNDQSKYFFQEIDLYTPSLTVVDLEDTVAGEEKLENENFPYFIEDDDHKQLMIAKGKHAEVCFTKTAYGVFLLGIVLLCTVLFVSFALLCRQRKLLKTNK
ncbi:Cuticlin-1 [Trichinella zimbabwensis]|uniref:Cuticlin-1 n=1 Tax=Trichinella zimbabwensis TaxID=268475 RepID=A0A0V1HF92_9BILA|nr:Cuticlin-1 [Trichinella zimbabwensis]